MIRALGDIINWLESQSPSELESAIKKFSITYKEKMNFTETEARLLVEWINIFEKHHDRKFNIQQLKEIYNLLSNPNTKIHISGGVGKSSLFDEYISIKYLVMHIIDFIRTNKYVKESINKIKLKKHRIIYKKSTADTKDSDKFSISEMDLQSVRINFAKREKTNFYNRRNKKNTGRIIRYTTDPTENSNIIMFQSILNSIKHGDYSLPNKKFNIKLQPEFRFIGG